MTIPYDEFEGLVAGNTLTTTIAEFKRRAAVILEEEQARANPDNHLIAFAADAIRLAREHVSTYRFSGESDADSSTRPAP